jgi:hypothetical protein
MQKVLAGQDTEANPPNDGADHVDPSKETVVPWVAAMQKDGDAHETEVNLLPMPMTTFGQIDQSRGTTVADAGPLD